KPVEEGCRETGRLIGPSRNRRVGVDVEEDLGLWHRLGGIRAGDQREERQVPERTHRNPTCGDTAFAGKLERLPRKTVRAASVQLAPRIVWFVVGVARHAGDASAWLAQQLLAKGAKASRANSLTFPARLTTPSPIDTSPPGPLRAATDKRP